MTVQQPVINVNFKQKAFSFIQRSARGNAVLIVKDDTNKTFTQKVYKTVEEVDADSALYTATNLQYIKDTLIGLPSKTTVIRIDIASAFSVGLTIAEALKTGWVGFVSALPADYVALSVWIKAMMAKKYTFMGLEFAPTTAPDCENCHTLVNAKVVFSDARGEQTTEKLIPTMLGICAGANVEKGLTYKVIPNLSSVTEVADIDIALSTGNLVLKNDEGVVRIVLGINSLVTTSADKTEDFKFIEVIEINNLISDDIRKEFSVWLGNYKNTYDNQVLFIADVNNYLTNLAGLDILDKDFDNKVEVDVVEQKKAWVLVNPLAVEWDETKVRNTVYKRQLFLRGNVKELQSMTDMQLTINLA
jgi:hypothetical protein